ncbi:MAG: cytochrome c maturation protein CcmE [Alphaproteobacteria bacterium]|nr:cytochrome c maturation protein CcmE [Alphaproteobacteria bacterium]
MTRKQKRLTILGAGAGALALAAALVLFALRDTVTFFYSPSDLAGVSIDEARAIRIGGLVAEGSVERGNGLQIRFVVTDGPASVPVAYEGALPDLFREGQGVIAEGRLGPDGLFRAETILAKHDESYMPPEVADALKRSGTWKDGSESPGSTTGGT